MRALPVCLGLLFFLAAGFAANVSCSGNASGNWYITNQNVVCQDAFALNMTGTTVYIQGYSNVTFYNITNTSINVYVYGNGNFTLNNGSLASLSSSGFSNITIKNNSGIIFSTMSFSENSTVLIDYSTVASCCDERYVSFSGSSATVLNSIISNAGAYAGVRFTNGTTTMINLTITTKHHSSYPTTWFYFSDSSIVNAFNSSFTVSGGGIYFWNNTQVNATNITFSSVTLSTSSAQQMVINNVSSSANNLTGYIYVANARANLFNSSISRLSISADGPTNITNSSFSYTACVFSTNSNLLLNSTTLSAYGDERYVSFSGSSATVLNSIISNAGAYAGVRFTNGTTTMINLTITTKHHSSYPTTWFYFSDSSIVNAFNSSFTVSGGGIYFWNNTQVNATSTILSDTKTFSESGTFYNKNYFTLFVNDSAGRALRNVSVVAYNATSGEVDFKGSTDAFGWLNNSALLWYKQNATQAFNVTLTVNVTGGDALNQSSYDMNTNKWYNATMGGRFNYFVGTPSTTNFAPTITVNYGNESLRPWNGSRQVELRTGTTLVANLSWNFSAGDLNLSNVTVTYDASEHYVGLNGTNVTPLVTTFWVPVWGKVCNVRVCSGKANYSHCAASDWTTASSVTDGAYCVVATNGTVVQDRPSAVTTKVVIRVPGWDEPLIAVLFALTVGLFAVRGQRVRRGETK